jgi:adenylate cyclase class IV
MSKEVKILRALEEKEQHSNSILASGAKIEKDRKVRKEFNVNLIQAKTIEALLRFLELEPSEKPQDLDHKLNQHRIEI